MHYTLHKEIVGYIRAKKWELNIIKSRKIEYEMHKNWNKEHNWFFKNNRRKN